MPAISESSTVLNLIKQAGFSDPAGVDVQFFIERADTPTNARLTTSKHDKQHWIVIQIPKPLNASFLPTDVIVVIGPDAAEDELRAAVNAAVDFRVTVAFDLDQAAEYTAAVTLGFDEDEAREELEDVSELVIANSAQGVRDALTAWLVGSNEDEDSPNE